jgi:hypothetical protein
MNKLLFLLIYLVWQPWALLRKEFQERLSNVSAGEVLLGTTIQNHTNNRATTTDMNGLFSIAASQAILLKISYVGKIPQQINRYKRYKQLTLTLLNDVASLEEIGLCLLTVLKLSEEVTELLVSVLKP